MDKSDSSHFINQLYSTQILVSVLAEVDMEWEEGAPGAVDGVEAVDEVEGRVQGNLERPPAQLHGCGRMTSRT